MRSHRSIVRVALLAILAQSALGCWNWDRLAPLRDAAPADALSADVSSDDAIDATGCGANGAPCCPSDGGGSCAVGLLCTNATCLPCPAGRVLCRGTCADVSTDPANCGACGHSCGTGGMCVAGGCVVVPPSNDTRGQATVIDTTTSAITLSVDTTLARHDATGTCACTTGNDVFYQFTLDTLEIVYVDTVGSSFDTAVFLQDATGNNLVDSHLVDGSTCSNDGSLGCNTGAQSLLAAKLFDGTYYLVISGCGAGQATVHFQHLPVGAGTLTRITPVAGASQQFNDSLAGTGTITSACASDGPENTYWLVTCPSFATMSLHASTCGGATIDTELDQRSATRTPVSQCNDNACGMQSLLDSMLPAGAGLHTLYVDSSATAAGSYTLSVTFGNCTTGTLCFGACANLQTDPDHCGTCGTVCTATTANTAPSCVAGSCATQCVAGFGDCNGVALDGCETALDTVDHCGGCGTVCSSANGTPACGTGGCSIVCDPGFADCDGQISTGCECNLATDRNDCGACGHRCVGSRNCVSGSCV